MPNYRNPTTSKQQVTPGWYGPVLSKQTNLGLPLAAINPNAQPSLYSPGPIFPSPISYRDAINSSLNMLFGTRPGERFWMPSYGINLDALVFEVLDTVTTQQAQQTIRMAITQWEPRVVVQQVNLATNEATNQVSLQVVLQLAGSPPDDVFTYSTSVTPSS